MACVPRMYLNTCRMGKCSSNTLSRTGRAGPALQKAGIDDLFIVALLSYPLGVSRTRSSTGSCSLPLKHRQGPARCCSSATTSSATSSPRAPTACAPRASGLTDYGPGRRSPTEPCSSSTSPNCPHSWRPCDAGCPAIGGDVLQQALCLRDYGGVLAPPAVFELPFPLFGLLPAFTAQAKAGQPAGNSAARKTTYRTAENVSPVHAAGIANPEGTSLDPVSDTRFALPFVPPRDAVLRAPQLRVSQLPDRICHVIPVTPGAVTRHRTATHRYLRRARPRRRPPRGTARRPGPEGTARREARPPAGDLLHRRPPRRRRRRPRRHRHRHRQPARSAHRRPPQRHHPRPGETPGRHRPGPAPRPQDQDQAAVPRRRARHPHPQGPRPHHHLRHPRRLSATPASTPDTETAGPWNRPPPRNDIRASPIRHQHDHRP
jgi:hypothetical protein